MFHQSIHTLLRVGVGVGGGGSLNQVHVTLSQGIFGTTWGTLMSLPFIIHALISCSDINKATSLTGEMA